MATSFRRYFLYHIFISAAAFCIGRIVPKSWFKYDAFPFHSFAFEKGGKLYERLGIKKWQTRIPDMSRIFTGIMPPKNLQGAYAQRLPIMIQETCIAECTHEMLCIFSLFGLTLWDSPLRFVLTAFYILVLNLPYILVQRYNRPRLLRIWKRTQHCPTCDTSPIAAEAPV